METKSSPEEVARWVGLEPTVSVVETETRAGVLVPRAETETLDFSLTREEARNSPRWRELRCQTCHGLGTVAAYSVYRDLGDGVVNAEDVGERLCKDCDATGLGPECRAVAL